MFEEQPGAVYGILGSSLDIRCVTETEPARYYWLMKNSDGVTVTIASMSGVISTLTGTGNRDISLRIKNVTLNVPQVCCQVFFRKSDGTLGPEQLSSTSNITAIGKSESFILLLRQFDAIE